MIKVACLLVLGDERLLLPSWLAYHGYVFGYENLFVWDRAPVAAESLNSLAALGVKIAPAAGETAADMLNAKIAAFREDGSYDIVLLPNVDEFVAVETAAGFSCARSAIFDELTRAHEAGGTCRARYSLRNAPGYFDLFRYIAFNKSVIVVPRFAGLNETLEPIRDSAALFGETAILHIRLQYGPWAPGAGVSAEAYYQLATLDRRPLLRFQPLRRLLGQQINFPETARFWEAGRPETLPDDLLLWDMDETPFRPDAYLAANPALAKGALNGFREFLRSGYAEGRLLETSPAGVAELLARNVSAPHPDAYDAVVASLRAMPDGDETDELYRRAIERFGSQFELLRDSARSAMSHGAFRLAVRLWKACRAAFPDEITGYDEGMIACAAAIPEHRDAILLAGIKRFPYYATVGIAEAEQAVAALDLPRAKQIYRALVRAHPDAPAVAASLARVTAQSGYFNPLTSQFDGVLFMDHLVSGRLDAALFAPAEAANAQDLKEQIIKSYRFINLSRHDVHETLIAEGIAPAFLDLAAQGTRVFVKSMFDWAAAEFGPVFNAPRLSPTVAEALIGTKTGLKHTLSPWTGAMTSTMHSLGPRWFLFGDEADGFICGQLSEDVNQVQDTVWVLPRLKTILMLGSGLSDTDVLVYLSRMLNDLLSRYDRVAAYLKSSDRQFVVYAREWSQFGHHVWNVLSAWGTLFDFAAPGELKTIVSVEKDEFFGSLSNIFDLPRRGIAEISIGGEADILDLILEKNLLISTILSDYLRSETCEAVVGHALRNCAPQFREDLTALAQTHWPVVLFSLRLENRAWVDQVDGFAEIARHIVRDFPNAAFLIHGLSRGVTIGSSTTFMSIEAEVAVAAEIENAITDFAPVLSAVGRMMHENVAVSEYCDMFVAPVGSGMALYKWLTNKPGVAFSNRYVLQNMSKLWVYLVFDHCRPNIIASRKLPDWAATDVEDSRRGSQKIANFTLDRKTLYTMVKKLILTLPNRLAEQAAAD